MTTLTKEELEQLLRNHIRAMEALFEEWRTLCREKGWKSGLSK